MILVPLSVFFHRNITIRILPHHAGNTFQLFTVPFCHVPSKEVFNQASPFPHKPSNPPESIRPSDLNASDRIHEIVTDGQTFDILEYINREKMVGPCGSPVTSANSRRHAEEAVNRPDISSVHFLDYEEDFGFLVGEC